MYIGYFLFGLLYKYYKFLYEWKKQVLYMFECVKLEEFTTMNMMKMLNYQFIIQLLKVFYLIL